jgi:hypothetical protein
VKRPDLSRRARDLYAVLALLVLGTLFFFDVLILGRALYLRDLTRYYYPTKRIVREVILKGEFPYWNPYYSAGQPMAANPEYEVFYPPQWLVLLPSYDFGYRLHIVVHVYVALVGMYALLRSMDLRIRSALFGAVAFGVGGLYLSMVNLLPIMFCLAWVPLILLFVRRCFLVPNIRDFSLAALFIGMQCLAAEPTTLVQTWFLAGCYALYRGWHNRGRRFMAAARNVALLGLMIAAGALVGAAQMLPAMDHVGDSARARPFELSLVTSWSMPWAKPLELLLPHVFGHMSVDNVTWYWGSGMYPNTGSGFLYNIYCGLPVIALVLAAFAVRPRGGRAVLLIVAASVVLALGKNTPLFEWLYEAGIGRSIRYPEKFATMGLFALMVLAAVLFDRILDRDERLLNAAIGICLGAGIFGLGIAVFSLTPWFGETFSMMWGYKGTQLDVMVRLSRIDWWMAAARGFAFAGFFWWARTKTPDNRWFAAFMVVLCLDLWWVGRELKPTFPRNFFTPPPVEATMDRDKSQYRVFHEPDWYGTSATAKKYFSTGSSVYWVVRNGLYPMTPATWGFRTVLERDYDKTALLTTIDFVEAMWRVYRRGTKGWLHTFMAMSNGRYHARFAPFDEERKRIGGRFINARPIVFDKVAEYPRFYFSGSLVKIRDVDDFVEKLINNQYPRDVAFVHLPPFKPASARVIRSAETSNSAAIDVQAEGQAFLVASLTNHKYWRATIDGREVPIHVTNIGYQGVVVPEGRHRVEFRYRNPIVVAGVWTSVLSVLALGFAAMRRKAVHFTQA